MQTKNLIAKLRFEPLAQILGEERVVAIPLTFLVEGHKQQLTLLD